MPKVFIYVRVSSEHQRDNNRFSFQEKTLVDYAERNNWEYEIFKEVRSGKEIAHRPVMKNLLVRLTKKEANGVLAYSVDRLTRNVTDGIALLDRSVHEGWRIYIYNIYSMDDISFKNRYIEELNRGATELEILSKRTKEGLSESKNKAKFGSKKFPTFSEEVLHRIKYLRERRKLSFEDIAKKLNEENLSVARPEISQKAIWYEEKVRNTYHQKILCKVYKSDKPKQRRERLDDIIDKEVQMTAE